MPFGLGQFSGKVAECRAFWSRGVAIRVVVRLQLGPAGLSWAARTVFQRKVAKERKGRKDEQRSKNFPRLISAG